MRTAVANGVLIGLVESLDDPEGLGRVRVRFPWLEDVVSEWARLVAVGGGADRGVYFRPEVDDEVVVAFEQQDFRRPLVLGGLWNRSDPPPADDGETAVTNIRQLRSRSGHVIRFDDTDGKERIEIVDAREQQRIVIDAADGGIRIETDGGDVTIVASAGAVQVEAAKEVKVKADSSISLEAPSIDVKASGELVLKGATVRIN